jgi:hypothetical protein
LAAALKPLHQAIDRLERGVSIRMLGAFFEFPIRLQTIALLLQKRIDAPL